MAATRRQVHLCPRLQSRLPKLPAGRFRDGPAPHQQTTIHRNTTRIRYITRLLDSVSLEGCLLVADHLGETASSRPDCKAFLKMCRRICRERSNNKLTCYCASKMLMSLLSTLSVMKSGLPSWFTSLTSMRQ